MRMFASFRLRLFSSASSGSGGASSGAAANYTIQQAGRDIARTVRQRADLPFGTQGGAGAAGATRFFEFGPDFFKAFDARKLQKDLLQMEIQAKQKKEKGDMFETTWNPSKYVQDVVREAGYLPPVGSPAADASKEPEQPAEEPFWERNKRVQAIAASHKPVELIKTGKEIHFMNGFFLSRFISDGGKVLPRFKSGLNAKQQRKLSREIRKARQLGILPIMQKFLPPFEANLPAQALANPLAGVWKPLPYRRKEFAAALGVPKEQELSKEEISQLTKQAQEEIAAEKDFQGDIKMGIPEIDELVTEKDLINYLIANKRFIPELYSPARLRFRAAEVAFSRMAPGDVRAFLEQRNAEISDCTKDDHYAVRAKQYLHAFEEQIFPDSKTYNSIRFSKERMRLFKTGKPSTGPSSSTSTASI